MDLMTMFDPFLNPDTPPPNQSQESHNLNKSMSKRTYASVGILLGLRLCYRPIAQA